MNLNDVIAVNLKRLRTERNLSLGGLAELSGVSKVMLSQIEKGESNPTINTIWKIAVGLQVSYTRLIDSPLDHAMIIRKEESSRQSENEDRFITRCYYTTSPQRNFEMFTVEMAPQAVHISEGHTPKTQEYILVQTGTLQVEMAAGSYDLSSGDSMYFDCSLAHTFRNLSDSVLTFVDVIYYL